MCVLSILSMSRCRGTVSKALLMSMAAIIVLSAGLFEFKPSSVVCERWVRRVDVECWDLKPCCEGDSGICGEMLFRTNLSSILEGVESKEIGLYEVSSVGGLLGFRIGIILASFQVLGILLFCSEKLKMSVKALMASGPKCFRCLLDMPSGPVEEVFLETRMASVTIAGVKGGVRSF